jgi:hypothetical protein
MKIPLSIYSTGVEIKQHRHDSLNAFNFKVKLKIERKSCNSPKGGYGI